MTDKSRGPKHSRNILIIIGVIAVCALYLWQQSKVDAAMDVIGEFCRQAHKLTAAIEVGNQVEIEERTEKIRPLMPKLPDALSTVSAIQARFTRNRISKLRKEALKANNHEVLKLLGDIGE